MRAVRRRRALSPWGQRQIPSEPVTRRHRLCRVPPWITHTSNYRSNLAGANIPPCRIPVKNAGTFGCADGSSVFARASRRPLVSRLRSSAGKAKRTVC